MIDNIKKGALLFYGLPIPLQSTPCNALQIKEKGPRGSIRWHSSSAPNCGILCCFFSGELLKDVFTEHSPALVAAKCQTVQCSIPRWNGIILPA